MNVKIAKCDEIAGLPPLCVFIFFSVLFGFCFLLILIATHSNNINLRIEFVYTYYSFRVGFVHILFIFCYCPLSFVYLSVCVCVYDAQNEQHYKVNVSMLRNPASNCCVAWMSLASVISCLIMSFALTRSVSLHIEIVLHLLIWNQVLVTSCFQVIEWNEFI